jgi:hypothetical protein
MQLVVATVRKLIGHDCTTVLAKPPY